MNRDRDKVFNEIILRVECGTTDIKDADNLRDLLESLTKNGTFKAIIKRVERGVTTESDARRLRYFYSRVKRVKRLSKIIAETYGSKEIALASLDRQLSYGLTAYVDIDLTHEIIAELRYKTVM